MKKNLIFFFFLLLFSHCDHVGNIPLTVTPGAARLNKVPASPAGTRVSSANPLPSLLQEPKMAKKRRIKKGKTQETFQYRTQTATPARTTDTLFISRLNHLRSNRIEPDMNEPVSKNYLFPSPGHPQSESLITLSRESFLKINFDNDILDYTDRFYTNGIRIEIISPGLQMNPLSRLTVPYWGSGTNYYGLSLVQNMFTPSTTKKGGILYGDRPYAAYLYVGSFKITNDPAHHFRQTSELDAGIIGPNSYGEWVQQSFHNAVPTNNEPLGWEYQVQNDLVLNYGISYEKGIVSRKNFELLLCATGNAGTLYTNLSGGGQIRAGWLNPYFANLGVARQATFEAAGLKKFQFFFFVKGSSKLVAYDATLQGGLFNRSSVYTIPSKEVSSMIFQGSGGITLSCNGVRLDVEQYMLSPEFHNGWWHKWVHVALTFSLH